MAASTGGHGATYRPPPPQGMPRPPQDGHDLDNLSASRYARWDGTASHYRDTSASKLRDGGPAYTKHASSSASYPHAVASHQPHNIQNKLTPFPRPVGSYASYPQAEEEFNIHPASDKVSPYSPSLRFAHTDYPSASASSTSRAETYRPGHQTKHDIILSTNKETRGTALRGNGSGVLQESPASSAPYPTTLNRVYDPPYGNSESTGRASNIPRHIEAGREPVNFGLDTDSRTNNSFQKGPYQRESSVERSFERSYQKWGAKAEMASSFGRLDAREVSGRLDHVEHNIAKSSYQGDPSQKHTPKNRPHEAFPEPRPTKTAAIKRPVVDPESLCTSNSLDIGAPREEHRQLRGVPDRPSGMQDSFGPQTQARTGDRLKHGNTLDLLDFLKYEMREHGQPMNVTDRLDLQHRQHPLKGTNRLESRKDFDGPVSKAATRPDSTGHSVNSTHLLGSANIPKALERLEVSTQFAEDAKQSWDYDSSVHHRSKTATTWTPKYSYQDTPYGNNEISSVSSTRVAHPSEGFSSASQSQSVVNRLDSRSSSNVEYSDYSLPIRSNSPSRFNRQVTRHHDGELHPFHHESSRSQRPVLDEEHRHGDRLAKASSPRSMINSERVDSRHTEDYDRGPLDFGTASDNTKGGNGFHSLPASENIRPIYGQAFTTPALLGLEADDLGEHNTGHVSSFKPRFAETDYGLPARHSAASGDLANLPTLQRRSARDQPSNLRELRAEPSARLEPRAPQIRRRSPEAVGSREAMQQFPAPPIKRYTPLFPLPNLDDVDERICPDEENQRQFSREGSLGRHRHREPSLHRYEGNATNESLAKDVRQVSSSTSRVEAYHVPHDSTSYCNTLGRSPPSAAPAISSIDVGFERYEHDRAPKRSRSTDSPSLGRHGLGRSPPQARINNSPPRSRLGRSPLRTRLCNSPPRARLARSPPRARLGRSPPRSRLEDSPPRARLGRSPPRARLENFPPRTRLENSPPRVRLGRSPPRPRLGRSPLRGMLENSPPRARLENSPPRARLENSPTRVRLENLPTQARLQNSAPRIGLGRSPLRSRLENSPPRARLGRSPPRARPNNSAPRARHDNSPPRTSLENSASRGKLDDSHRTKLDQSPLRHRLEDSPPRARLGRFPPRATLEGHPARDSVRARLDRSPIRARVDKPLRRGRETSPLRSDGKRSPLVRRHGKSPLPHVDNDKSHTRIQQNGSPQRPKSPARRTVPSHQSSDLSSVSGLSRALQERISRRSKSVQKRSPSPERKSTVPVRDPKNPLGKPSNTVHLNQKNRGGVNTPVSYRDSKSKNNSAITAKSSNIGHKPESTRTSVKRKLETDSSSQPSSSKKVSLDASSNKQPKATPLAKKKFFKPIVFTPEDFGKKPDGAGGYDESRRSLKDSSSSTQISTSNTRTSSSQNLAKNSRTSSAAKSASTSNLSRARNLNDSKLANRVFSTTKTPSTPKPTTTTKLSSTSRPSTATPSSTTRPSSTVKPSAARPLSSTKPSAARPSFSTKPSAARPSSSTKPSAARPLSSTKPSTARLSSTAAKASSSQLLSHKGSGCEVGSSRAAVRSLRDDIAKFGGDSRAAATTSSQEELRLLLLKAKENHVEQKLRDLEKKEKETAKKLRTAIVW